MPVRYSWGDLPAILSNPRGGRIIRNGVATAAWPVLRPLASLARATRSRRSRIAGVTGSFGKTTTTRAIAAALGAPTPELGANHKSGVALTVLALPPKGFAAIELGIDGPGQMARYSAMVRPDLAVVTAVGSEHRSTLETLENTQQEKGRLVRGLRADGTAILNGEDPLVRQMATWTRARIILCGQGDDCQVRLLESSLDWPRGLVVRASVFGEPVEVRTRLLGRHMAFPILAGLAAAHAGGVELAGAAERLANLEPVGSRMEITPLDNGAVLVDDSFKSSFETILAAFDAMAAIPARRKLAVLGDVSEPPGKQGPVCRRIGSRAAEVFDQVFCIGRHYDRYRAGATQNGMDRNDIVQSTLQESSERLAAELRAGDVLLIKGRDTQRLERVKLGLLGRRVGCDLRYCDLRPQRCDECVLLERGWDGLPRFMRAD